jgi:SSS family solute:Na+ symporter
MGLGTIIAVVIYLMVVGYLGYRGFRNTRTAADYLVAGRAIHPFVMAMSYGATFISTSAIVGFGGVAGLFGMSLLWLTFCNIFVGIFIAFVFLGAPTRKMGHHLDAHTFPELLGRRFDSRFIQVFTGLVIFLFIPLYAAAVLIGGCEFIATQFQIDYKVALLVFSAIIALYVVAGGLKGVMYTDALQGTIMFVGMLILLIATYIKVGGVIDGHQSLERLADLVPGTLKSIGHTGWTSFPKAGFGSKENDLWWIVVSTITLGVGIGVLAQPQLVVRFMTVKSKMELNRAVLIGGIFILVMTGVAFTVGSLSNAYFAQNGPPLTGRVVKQMEGDNGHAVIQLMARNESGEWTDVEGKMAPVVLLPEAEQEELTATVNDEQVEVVKGRSISIVYAKGNPDQIIPTYITAAMPHWFGLIFLLTLLAAAMSTLSSQFHTLGTSIGRDVYGCLTGSHEKGITATRVGILVGIVIAVIISYHARGGYIIARATAIFFGLCASSFLPAYVGGLFFKRITRTAAVASMIVGFLVSGFWLTFIKSAEASALGLVQKVTDGKTSLLEGVNNWPVVDPIVIALPISILVVIVVSLLSKPMDAEHVSYCFGSPKKR